MKKKIIIISGFLPEKVGGISNHATNLLESLRNENIESLGIDKYSKRNDNLVYGVQKNPIVLIKIILRNRKKAIFHFHISRYDWSFFCTTLLSFFFKINFIVTIHSGNFFDWLVKKNKTVHFFFKIGFEKVNYIISVNEDLKRKAISFNHKLFQKVYVIDSYIPKKHVVKRKTVNDRDFYTITLAGAYLEHYRLEDAIMAINLINYKINRPIRLQFLIAMFNVDKNYKKKLKEIAKHNDNSFQEIQFLEDVNNPLVVFEESDLFIRTSEVDSFGITVAEALQVGTPSIATSVCERPKGAQLYEAGDIKTLSNLIEYEIKNINRPRKPIENNYNGYEKIKKVYNLFFIER